MNSMVTVALGTAIILTGMELIDYAHGHTGLGWSIGIFVTGYCWWLAGHAFGQPAKPKGKDPA